MAIIALNVTLDTGSTFSASVTMTDANAHRVATALTATYFAGMTNQQVLQLALGRLMKHAVALTQAAENPAPAPISIT